MKRIEKFATVLILIICLATACKKEEKASPPITDDTISILQSGDWKITAFTITSASNDLTDVMLNMPPCAKDNFLQFKNNSVLYFDEGATKCNPTDGQTETGTWSYDTAIKQLKFKSASLDFVINIKTISNSSISGTREVVMNGASYIYSGTLTKQ